MMYLRPFFIYRTTYLKYLTVLTLLALIFPEKYLTAHKPRFPRLA